ncbi:MAG: Gldg family protein [Clostridia bacterium]|nr:Gldg family protein [Clostridia bacterium]
MKEKLKAFFASRATRHAGGMAAFTALVLALFYLVNLIVLGFANKFTWYFYTSEQPEITVSGAADELFRDIDTSEGKVKIRFCDLEENIKAHNQLDYVYETAVLLRDRYPDLIELDFISLWLEPEQVSAYRVAEDGSENTITTSTVIIDYCGEFVLNAPVNFYTLDEKQYATSYNGEEVFVANILWVSAKEHPVAYFTGNHGEEVPYALQRMLIYAGYRVEMLDLSTVRGVPEDAGMLVIADPIYNFQKAAEGSVEKAELTFVEDYLARGGQVLVMLAPTYAETMKLPNGKPPHLLTFLSEYGITVPGGTLIDRESALPGSGGYSLITSYAGEGLGASLGKIATAGGRRTVLSMATPLSLGESEKATVSPILYTSASTTLIGTDGSESSMGSAPVLAMAELKEGDGRLLVAGSPYLADIGMVDGASYGNKALINALLSEMGAERVPAGVENIQIDRTAIENLTMGEVDIYLTVAAVVLPVCILALCFILLRRRKNH